MADAIKVAHAVLHALWAEEKNTGDPATLKAIIAELRPRCRCRHEGGRSAGNGAPSATNTPRPRSRAACSAHRSSSSTASGSGARIASTSSSASWRPDQRSNKAAAATAKPLFTMCATSDGKANPVRRSQPNQRASGSTRMMCAGSTWAAAKASELTIQAAAVPHRPADPSVEQAAKHQLLDQRCEAGDHKRLGEDPGLADNLHRFLDALRLEAELVDRDRQGQGNHGAQHERPPADTAKSERRQGSQAHGRHGDAERNQGGGEEHREQRHHAPVVEQPACRYPKQQHDHDKDRQRPPADGPNSILDQ